METKNHAQQPNRMEVAAAAIADRCAKDLDWMEKLKADPRQALQEMIGKELPADMQIHLHQNDDENWHVPVSGTAGGKLSDEDLHKIAGGELFIAATYAAVAVGVGVGIAAGAGAGAGIAVGVGKSDKKKGKK